MLKNITHNESKGFSLLELMLVLGAIAAIIVAAFMIFPKIENSRKANEEIKNIITLKSGIIETFNGKAEYDASLGDYRLLSKISPRGDKFSFNEWSAYTNVTLQMNNLGFAILTRAIPQDACIKIVTQLKEHFVRIYVNDIAVYSITKYYAPIPFDIANVSSKCADNSMIQMDYY